MLKAPAKALECYWSAGQELRKARPDTRKTIKKLEQAVKEYPDFSAAWSLLGEIRLAREDVPGAREAFQSAIASDPGFVTPAVKLSMLELKEGNLGEAAMASEHAIDLVPELLEARYYHGTAYARMGEYVRAHTSLAMVVKSPEEKRFPRAHYIPGVVYARSGNQERAVSHCLRYLELEPSSELADVVRKQLDTWNVDNSPSPPAARSGQPLASIKQ